MGRGKVGTKRHMLTDRNGVPLAFVLTGANVHDSVPLTQLLDAVTPVKGRRDRPRQRPGKLHADKGYDYPRCRRACRQCGIQPRIARRGVESTERLGRLAPWLFARMRRLSIHHAFTSLGVLSHLLQCASGEVLKGAVNSHSY